MTDNSFKRACSPKLDAILGKKVYTLGDEIGFIMPVDYMGNDETIANCARVSYAGGTKQVRDYKGLIRFLMRHHHCYHPSMQVLTSSGWKRWDELDEEFEVMVPDPESNTLKSEVVELLKFDYEGEMCVFNNGRMDYCVTPEHKIWFRRRYDDSFEKIEARDASVWGDFEGLSRYSIKAEPSSKGQFIGFYLGGGCVASTDTLYFRLSKAKKITYLNRLIGALGLKCCIGSEDGGRTVLFSINKEDWMSQLVSFDNKSWNNKLIVDISQLKDSFALGVLDGLVNSNGKIKKGKKNKIEFSSVSKDAADLFMNLSSMFGRDAHYDSKAGGKGARHCKYNVKSYGVKNRSKGLIESRSQYHSRTKYKGKVFCCTTSTGLLVVRGGDDSFAVVSGNSSPFEMCKIMFQMRIPLFAQRQMVRHRTGTTSSDKIMNLNEESGRYSVLEEEVYIPPVTRMCTQSAFNKQQSGDPLPPDTALALREELKVRHKSLHDFYLYLIGRGLVRELSRTALSQSQYITCVFCMDAHNLMHFMKLRLGDGAQYEIKVYAQAIADIFRIWLPETAKAWEEYRLNSEAMSATEMKYIRAFLRGESTEGILDGMSKGERKEFADKLGLPTL